MAMPGPRNKTAGPSLSVSLAESGIATLLWVQEMWGRHVNGKKPSKANGPCLWDNGGSPMWGSQLKRKNQKTTPLKKSRTSLVVGEI